MKPLKSPKRRMALKSLVFLWASRIRKGDIVHYICPAASYSDFDFIARNKHNNRILMRWSEVEILDHQERLTYLHRRK